MDGQNYITREQDRIIDDLTGYPKPRGRVACALQDQLAALDEFETVFDRLTSMKGEAVAIAARISGCNLSEAVNDLLLAAIDDVEDLICAEIEKITGDRV